MTRHAAQRSGDESGRGSSSIRESAPLHRHTVEESWRVLRRDAIRRRNRIRLIIAALLLIAAGGGISSALARFLPF